MSSANIIESLVRHSVDLAAEIHPIFVDRSDAGYKLADLLNRKNYKNSVLITIPSGGVPVAIAISERLGVPIHLTFAAKVRFCSDRRFGIGTVSQTGEVFLNQEMLKYLALDDDVINEEIYKAKLIMDEKIKKLADVTLPIPSLRGSTVILAEDGVATGYTVLAAAQALESFCPDSIVIASPVISDAANRKINNYGFEQVFLEGQKGPAFLVDNCYYSFPQISIEEVRYILARQNYKTSGVVCGFTGN